ncbi:hypothetical protein H6F96_24935 [Microcoleus sp. FACHB-53]|nr:hypothetical protein [Microcoleus sp. FACHB-53]MBD2130538.1 hypothetical protein [Microcoleus sp. FACHB-1]
MADSAMSLSLEDLCTNLAIACLLTLSTLISCYVSQLRGLMQQSSCSSRYQAISFT